MSYLASDDETRFITMYLEGVRDGQKLLRQVRNVNSRKPVIIYKSGLTESGARAVSSHTGSMAGGEKIWKAFFRQTGAVQVESLEEMADVLLAFHHIGTSPGRKTAVLGIGGGNGVAVADHCARTGLELPALSPEVINKLKKTIAHNGAMIRNPIDSVSIFVNLQLMGDTLELLAESGEIDNFILSMPIDLIALSMGNYAEIVATYLATEGRKRTHGKPLIVVWRQYQPDPAIKQSISAMEDILLSAGITSDNEFRVWHSDKEDSISKEIIWSQIWGNYRSNDDESEGDHGWRLQASPIFIEELLNKMNMDLIVKVEIKRSLRHYRYERSTDDGLGYIPPYFRIFIFRSNGRAYSL